MPASEFSEVNMRPLDVQVIGSELAIRWEDGSEQFIRLELLRNHCPCASCAGEQDIFGNVARGPRQPPSPGRTTIVRIAPVGGYAIQPIWGDGHSTGLYSFDYLRRLADEGLEPP